MRRSLRRPRNPDVLGRLIAALRVRGGQRPAANDAEREIDDALAANGVPSEAALRLVQALDAMPLRARSTLLGPIADPSFVPEGVPGRPEGASEPTTITVSTRLLEHLSRVLVDTGRPADGVVREEMHDGRPADQPVYTIVYRGLWCEEETTWDWSSWADEIYVITSAVHLAGLPNPVLTVRHPVQQGDGWYSDVDSDEARLGPIATCWQGNSDIVSLTVVLMEHDEGDPDAFKDEIDMAVKAALAVLAYFYPPAAWAELLSGTIADGINWFLDTDDDPIATQTVILPRALLEAYSTDYRATFLGSGQQHTGLEYHFLTTHEGGGATYVVGFEVLRDPERLPEGPFL